MLSGAIMKRTRAIFFDAGNTLVYPRLDQLAEDLTREGREATAEDFRAAERTAKQALDKWLWPQIRRGKVPRTIDLRYWHEYLTAVMVRLRVPEAERPAVTHRVANAFRQITFWSHVHPETPVFLESLGVRGFFLGVISNSNGLIGEQLDRVGLGRFFSVVIDSHHVGVEKPHPEIFQIALERVPERVDPSETVFVGDTHATDVGGAMLAGLRGILIDRVGAYPQAEGARITSLPELEPLL
jgi:HAD superfamily hydrolase (TIGR01509 family)